MAGQRKPANKPRPQPRDNGYGAPAGQKGYGKDATYQMRGGQLTVGNKSGARSWLGHPTATQTGNEIKYDGSGIMPVQLANMGKAKNGFEQFGYVPTGEQGQAGSQQFGRTPYAMPGMNRAGFVTTQGWDPKGKTNTKTWNAMQAAIEGGPKTGGHMEFGQKGQDTRQGTRGHNSQGGLPGQGVPGGHTKAGGFQTDVRPNGQPIGSGGGKGPGPGKVKQGGKKGGGKGGPLPNMPPPAAGGGMVGGVGEFPKMPTPPADFLPMTPGYEQDWRGLNDQLGAAEGQFAQGQAMLPAQYNLMNTRIQNDQDVATDRLKEDLANRGIYTAKNAAGTYGGTSPAGGGVGESLYSRNVATPFGRQYQDLAAQQAGNYQSLYGDYAGANLGYAQGINEALLNRANEAYQLDPMGLANSGYEVPDMASPYYPFAPQGRPRTGKRRPAKNKNKGKGKGKGKGK